MWMLVILTAFLAASAVSSQSPPTINVFTRLYTDRDEPITMVPFPIPNEFFLTPDMRSTLQGKSASYLRILVSASNDSSLSSPDAASVFDQQQPSNHTEERTVNRVKLVLWTQGRIVDRTTEVMVRSVQIYLQRMMQLRISNTQPSDGMQISFGRTFVPTNVTELEVEVMMVREEQLIGHPICRRSSRDISSDTGRPSPPPCPSFLLVDQMYMPTLAANDMLMSLDSFTNSSGNGTFNPFPDVAPFAKLNMRWNDSWVNSLFVWWWKCNLTHLCSMEHHSTWMRVYSPLTRPHSRSST